MAILNDPDDLSQGGSTSVSDAAWGTPSGADVTITSAGSGLPTIAAGAFFEVRSHSNAVNNGLYVATGSPTTASLPATKVSGANPAAAAGEAVTTLGTTAVPKSIFFDTAARRIYLIEDGELSADGVYGRAVYSAAVDLWHSDAFLIAAAPFPMRCIDYDAGKFILGQDPSGNYNGWNWADSSTHSIRTTKLLRSCGWTAYDAAGAVRDTWACIKTLGSFEADATDTAYYQLGTNQATNDSVDFTFAGPVNEAIKVYDATVCRAQATPNGFDFVDGGAGNDSVERNDGGSFITDGFKVGGRFVVANAAEAGNDGSYTILAVAAASMEVATGSFTADTDDVTATIDVDNRAAFAVKLRVRDADALGKTFASSNLAAIEETALTNKISAFPLSNAADVKITVTDATIDGSAPYTGMSITYYAAAQSLGGSGLLVGGPYNFGIVVDANNGTAEQVYAYVQRRLRLTTDVDAGAGTVIGRCADGLCRFLGDAFEVGSIDGGSTVPTNPLGGGSGVMVINLNAASRNDTTVRDNTGTVRSFPVSVTVTLDSNSIVEADDDAYAWLFFAYTIRTTVTDLVVNSAGTFTSAGGGLPTSIDGGDGGYILLSGLTGADAAMNGVYQVTETTSANSWAVQRYDGTAMATTTAASCTVDQHAVNTPGALIVDDSLGADIAGAATSDIVAAIDFSSNVQGGRTGGTTMYVVGKSMGKAGAQPYQGDVVTIDGTAPVTVPLAASSELNYSNPA